MATQEYIDDLIIVIETAEEAESVTNQMVAAVLDFLNVNLKKSARGEEIQTEEAARIAADAALQKAIDAVSLRIDRLVGNNASQAIDNFNEILNFLNGLKDSDSLAALLADINARIGTEDGSESMDGSLWGKLISLAHDISNCSNDISILQSDRDEMERKLQNMENLQAFTFTNVNNLLNSRTIYSDLSGVLAALKMAEKIDHVRKNGVILSFLTVNGWMTKQFEGDPDTDFENVEKWKDFGGGSGKGIKGDKGDALELNILGCYPTLDELKKEYPSGPDGGENGFFMVGDTLYLWSGAGYEPLNLDVYRTFSLEQFIEVKPSGSAITIDFSKTPYAKVTLSGDSRIFSLSINNVRDGVTGKILVFQTGFKQISVDGNIKGTIDLPLNGNTIALLTYNVLGDTIYMHSNTVLGDIQFPTPQRITDLQMVYSDSSVCTVQWSAPYANNIYDKATEYDMRYSNSLVDADDPKVWNGLKKVSGVPEPLDPGKIQKMTISGLSPNKEYYVYLKSVKVNYGVEYTSDASDFVYFKTLGGDDTGKAYRINLTERNLIPQLRNYSTDTDGTVCSIDKMVDEVEKNVFLDDGYPDTRNKEYTTFWSQYKYSRDTSPFDVFIDLFSEYAIDKLFVYSRSKPKFSVYGMKEQGYPWVRIGEIDIVNNAWKSLDFSSFQCRFIKLSFDLMDFGSASTSPSMPEGTEAFPDPEYNGTLERIDNVLLYGRPVSSRPEGIMPPLRKSTVRKTVDQFFCTNGHGYQQGRIHSMCSGELMRMYIHFGQFAANYNTPDAYSRLADMRFKVNQIGWVSGNNGTGEYLEDTLRNTYLKYGLKPYLCNTGVFDYCYYDRSVTTHNRPVDNYWYPDAWRPVPKRGVGGLDKYFGVTTAPENYRTYAKLCLALAAKYGSKETDGSNLFYPESESTATGLDLISGLEPANEPDQNWSGWIGYTHAEEYAAMISAASDGHDNSLTDEEGNILSGTKGGGVLSISSGTASVNRAYYLAAMMRWKSGRKRADIPVDVFSMHMYFSNIGNQGSSQVKVQYGITFEEAMKNVTGGELAKMVELRNRFAPDKEIALTEFGWGESGGREGSCKYQCYTQPGCQIGNWTVPDRHRSDVKGAWIVRACIQMMAMGIDFVNYYSTECEGNYFGAGMWDSGAGFEMFHWNDCTDTTPGAKAAAIKKYEHSFDRGGFATTGLFGQILTNGAYPITRAYWWIATMRTRLKGYVYTGMKYIDTDERIVVACFKKQGEDKGAYAVYLNDNRNTGVAGVEIPVPADVDSVRHVTVYVPDIPDPQDVPGNLGYDQKRTGLPTSRKERYVNGEWVLLNKPYMTGRYMSYTSAPATYPDNPKEGDEVTVLPTQEENPYFPIVGPVCAKSLVHGNNLGAQNYEQDREEWETEPNLDGNGNVIWTVKSNVALAWRQVDAVCDYIDYHPDGIHGRNGDEVTEATVRGMIQADVSEFPEFFLFDAVPEPDYRSEVTDFSSRTVSSSAVELWWNNTNTEDTGYQIFVSDLPETGYTLLKEVPVDVENKAVLSGLSQNTAYYFKIRPVRGSVAGTMSDCTSARTFSELPAPDNLRVRERTATSITLSWAYTDGQVADFVHYAIFRTDGSGAFLQIGKVEDKSVLTYTDSGLIVGHNYTYKVRAVGLNGQSAYTPELATRTLLAEECPPVIRYAMTDKLGTKVVLTFDLPIGVMEAAAKANFTLTEDGSLRLVNYAARDEANHNNLVLSVPQGSLKDYDQRTDIRVGFSGGGIFSEYGVELGAFDNVRVVNLTGNFTNIEATYKLNFCPATAPLPEDAEWNNIVGNPESDTISVNLLDSYGRTSGITVSPVQNKPAYNWGAPVESGYCEIPGIEEAVYKYAWRGPGFGADNSENMVARLKFSGLNDEYRYTFKSFGATTYGADLLAKIKVNGIYSETLNLKGNKTSYLTVEDCRPSGGIIHVDIINATEGSNTSYPVTAFMVVEEYKSNDAPENTDVFLREVVVSEAVDGVVRFPDVTLHLNCIGTALSYRVSESQDMDGAEWTDITDGDMDIPFTLSSGFGKKTVYVQVRNLYSESNVRVIELEYKDPYVPLVLRNVYINDDAGRTYSREVSVLVDKDGVPSHYKISESSDLSSVQWSAWPDPKLSVLPFTLSEGEGRKTVYVQIMDSTTICEAKADTINYVPVDTRTIELTVTLPEGADADAVEASFPVLKYNKKFIFTYTADDGPVGAYGKVWCAVNGKMVDDEKYFHAGQDHTTGYTPDKTLGYTDGCGIEHRLPVGVATWPNCGDVDGKNWVDCTVSPNGQYAYKFPYILWDDIIPILDFGGSVYFHNVNQDKWDKADPLKILQGLEEDQAKTVEKISRGMKVMMRPDGNNSYITAATMFDDLVMSFAENTPAVYLYPDDDPDLYKSVGQRKMYTDDNAAEMEWIKGIHDSDNPIWAHLFTHTPLQAIVDFLTAVNDAYGKDGDDSVWMASVDEVYEYWFVRKNSTIRKEVDGRTVKFIISVPVDRNFYHKDLCLNIGGVDSPEGVAIAGNDTVLGLSYAVNGDGLLVNVNYDEQAIARAEKYTALFERNDNAGALADARYFVGMLIPSQAAPFTARMEKVMQPPLLLEFAVIKTADSTENTSITFTFATDERATHYMISESPTFEGAEWRDILYSLDTFELSNEAGTHTLYFKVRNTYGESSVFTDTIVYTPAAFGLEEILLNAGATATPNREITVTFRVKGQTPPTHCMISESPAFEGAEWQEYASPAGFTLSDGNGAKTVYAKVRNATEESGTASASITLKASELRCVVSLNFDYVVSAFGGSTHVGVEEYNGEKINIIRDSYDNLALVDTAGQDFGKYRMLSPRNYHVDQPVEGEGIYPFKYISMAFGYTMYNQPDPIVPCQLGFTVPAGTYKVRILGNTSNASGANLDKLFYDANGVTVNPAYSLYNNYDKMTEIDDVTVSDDGDGTGSLVLKYWSNPTRGNSVAVNLIEIVRK